MFGQLYFRQALQRLSDQAAIIDSVFEGYAVPVVGPVPEYPSSSFLSSTESENHGNGPYPYSPSAAISLLSAHGWSVKPGGVTTCVRPGTAANECGAGIPAGTALSFSEVAYSGSLQIRDSVNDEVTTWAKAGIKVSVDFTSFPNVLKDAVACPLPYPPNPACEAWDMANWGGGWIYEPDYLPTGEEIFASGAWANTGSYNNPENNLLIRETDESSAPGVFAAWEDFLTIHVPVVWQPMPIGELEIPKDMGGVAPFNTTENLTPEYWYYQSLKS